MQARVKQSSRYGSITAFSGIEFVKHEYRKVPTQYEAQAKTHELLEIREGSAEKEIQRKQAEAKVKPVMKARLVSDYEHDTLRSMGDVEFTKDTWVEVPESYEESARSHELLQVWEAGAAEPKTKAKQKNKPEPKKAAGVFGNKSKKAKEIDDSEEPSEE